MHLHERAIPKTAYGDQRDACTETAARVRSLRSVCLVRMGCVWLLQSQAPAWGMAWGHTRSRAIVRPTATRGPSKWKMDRRATHSVGRRVIAKPDRLEDYLSICEPVDAGLPPKVAEYWSTGVKMHLRVTVFAEYRRPACRKPLTRVHHHLDQRYLHVPRLVEHHSSAFSAIISRWISSSKTTGTRSRSPSPPRPARELRSTAFFAYPTWTICFCERSSPMRR